MDRRKLRLPDAMRMIGALVRAADEPLADAFDLRADAEHGWVLDAMSLSAKCASHYSDQAPTAGSAKF